MKKYTALFLVLSLSSIPVMASEFMYEAENTFMDSDESLPLGTASDAQAAFEDDSSEEIFKDQTEDVEKAFSDGECESAMVLDDSRAREVWKNCGMSDNRNQQNYTHAWSKPMNSYLVSTGNGYMRVENRDNQILVEYYDDALKFQSQKFIPGELDIFGGFYAGREYYYLAFGQNNESENNDKEVVRVVKYDKKWNRLGQASMYGANTTQPFAFGCLRMVEYGEYLYVRSCHVMYKSEDGFNHQSSLSIQIRTSDMTVADSAYLVEFKGGYVSHSLNQFITVDNNGYLLSLDQGDGYPRGAALTKYNTSANSMPLSGKSERELVVSFPGGVGQNDTGASLGGLEASSSHYLTVGNTVKQDPKFMSYKTRNVYVTATSQNELDRGKSISRYYTNYPEGNRISASTPQLVKLGDDHFLLLWAQMEDGQANGKICYIFLNGLGRPESGVYTKNGYLSDCQPIVADGRGINTFAAAMLPPETEFISGDRQEETENLSSAQDILTD